MRGGKFWGQGGPENECICQNTSSFVLSQQDCELKYFPSQRRDATKARKGFGAASVSAWPSGLLCLRGELANPEHDAICQIHPCLLCYLCNTPFMCSQQMADHLHVLSFKKKLPTWRALKCRISGEKFSSGHNVIFLTSKAEVIQRPMPGFNLC